MLVITSPLPEQGEIRPDLGPFLRRPIRLFVVNGS
jgi:hypothetical protein